MVLRDTLCLPDLRRLGVLRGVVVAGERGDGQEFRRDVKDLLQELVAPGDGILLEVIAQRPVAQHLEEREVARVADLVYVAGPHAFLEIRESRAGGVFLSEQVGYERVHTRSGEKDCGVVLGNEGCGTYLCMSPRLEEIDIGFSEFLCFHMRTSDGLRYKVLIYVF